MVKEKWEKESDKRFLEALNDERFMEILTKPRELNSGFTEVKELVSKMAI